MRLLHIVPDQKFIDDAYTAFEEAAPGRNDFIVIGAAKAVRINRFEPQLLSLPELLGPDFPSRVARYDCLFIHYLNREARVAVDRCPAGTLLVWLGWGADYYHLIEDRRALLLPLTRSVYDRLQVRPKARLRAAVLYASRLLRGLGRPREVIAELRVRRRAAELGPGRPGELALLNRFALFAPVLYEDHQRVAASTPGFRPEFASWNYGVRDGLEEMRDSIESFGRNVLVGNSATFENNHLEALTMLRDAMSGDTQAICPLSYGRADYARSVARRGSEILGTRFRPLLEFLPIAEYMELLRSCSIVVMNHRRQQAVGNIALMLALGARVFLRGDNPVYRFLKAEGAVVFEMAELAAALREPRPLPAEDALTNRAVVVRHYGRDAVRGKTAALLQRVQELISGARRIG